MKKLDKYIGLNFIVSYAIAFFVLIGLRIIVDLFINIDEFALAMSCERHGTTMRVSSVSSSPQ
jgi:lipopolysaccharide export LptBFGC system permease protein LptF